MGWAAWFVRFIFFLSYRPLAQCWARGCPFCSSVCFSSVPPTPHSVRGHGLGNRTAKQRHGTVGFSCSFFFVVLPTPSSPPSRGAARVIWLLTQWHRTVCFVFFPCDARCFVFSFDMRFRLGTPPSRDCGLCHLSISCWSFFLAPPATIVSLREGFDFGFLCLRACVLHQFVFLRLAPPVTPTIRGRVLTVVGLAVAPFSSGPPPHWRYAADFDGWFAFL